MKIQLMGTFNIEQFRKINSFISTQETTDHEVENTHILLDDIDIVVIANDYEVKKITFRLEKAAI